MPSPEITLSLTTYQKPWHLRRALASIAGQRGVAGRMELVVTDDGSTDETAQVVEEFGRRVDFPVRFTTHEHLVYHPSRSRNDGARASKSPYILFIDGDCVLPPDHVAIHLAHRKPGVAMLGDCLRAEETISATLSEEGAARGDFLAWKLDQETRRLDRRHFKHKLYTLLRHSTKPKLVSNNVAIWRSDFERVNGFDENFCHWGCEDDDLGRRLRRAGVRLESILPYTRLVHLWHPRETSTTERWRDGANVKYFLRPTWLARCRNGLSRRPLSELNIRIAGMPDHAEKAGALLRQAGLPAEQLLRDARQSASPLGPPEIEILFWPCVGCFSGRAEFQVLVVLAAEPIPRRVERSAHRIVADQYTHGLMTSRAENNQPGQLLYPLAEFNAALDSIA